MLYLKRIYVCIEDSAYEGDFHCLRQKLALDHVELTFLTSANAADTVSPTDAGSPAKPYEAAQDSLASVEKERKMEACLWITDSAPLAARWVGEQKAVLALRHEKNREQDFSGLAYAMEEPAELEAVYLDRIYRRYRGLPWDILTTERCRLRETTVEDVDSFFRIYSDPEIVQYTEELYPDKEQERAYVREYIEKIYAFYQCGVWTVIEKSSGAVIGRAGYSFREGYEAPELGFVIALPWQRQGIAYEICRGILEYGREELFFERVQAFVQVENQASLRLCEKLGFEKREELVMNGKPHFRLEKCLYH